MIELNSKIKNALIKIDFIERYEELSNKFNAKRTPSSNRLAYIDSEEVMETIQDLGYSPVFDVKEKFYKIKEEQIGKITLEVHIILRYGMVDLVWIVRENGELLLGEHIHKTSKLFSVGKGMRNLDVVWLGWPVSFVAGTVIPYFCFQKIVREMETE